MHPAVPGVAGYIVLLTSFIIMAILLKRGFRCFVRSPFHALTTSNILGSVLTATILLFNHFKMINRRLGGDTDPVTFANDTWTDRVTSRVNRRIELSKYRDPRGIENSQSNAGAIIGSCDGTNVMMHYAMFLVPLTNTFASMLGFSIQCNISTSDARDKCTELLQPQESIERRASTNYETAARDPRNEQPNASEGINVSREHDLQLNKVAPFQKEMSHDVSNSSSKYGKVKRNNNQITGLCIISQWTFTIIVTGVLYLAEYRDTNTVSHADDAGCFYHASFPFYDRYDSTNSTGFVANSDSDRETTAIEDDPVTKADLFKQFHRNGTTTNQVVSNVQKIVQSMVNMAHGTIGSGNSSFFNESDLFRFGIRYSEVMNKPSRNKDSIRPALTANASNIANEFDKSVTAVQKRLNASIEETTEHTPYDAYGECFVSTRFIKVHLSIVMCIAYFVPILISSILQQRGKRVCQDILHKLEAKGTELFAVSEDLIENGESAPPKLSESSNVQTVRQGIGSKRLDVFDYEQMCTIVEIHDVRRLLDTVRRAFLFGVLLWFPVYLDILIKVLFCARTFEWQTDVTFLAAMFFEILKHLFDLKMVQIQEETTAAKKKTTRVHPAV